MVKRAHVLLAMAAAAAPNLVAQGAQAHRDAGRAAPAPAAAAVRPGVEPARTVLGQLAGTWRFEIRFRGNLNGPPDVSGTRTLSPVFDGLSLEWTEEIDDSPIRGRGLIAFDARSGQFLSTGVYSSGSAVEFMTGILDQGEPLITFHAVAPAPGTAPDQGLRESSTLILLDADHFTWVALDRAWRGMFTRQSP